MNIYNTIKDFNRKVIATGSLVSLLAGCSEPTLEQNKDLTGDGIPDAIVSIERGDPAGRWLFVGQADGSFVRAKQYSENGVTYFATSGGIAYFFDGTFYKPSLKQK